MNQRKSDTAKRAWLCARRLLRPIQLSVPRSIVLLGTSDLASAYCRELIPSLRAAGRACELLDLTAVQRQFGLSLAQARQLSGSWGAAVSFDHGRWAPNAPEIWLPHGLETAPRAEANRRPVVNWAVSPQNLLLPNGSQRYAAVGLTSYESIAQLLQSIPAIDPQRVHLVGDIRADRLLSALTNPDPRKVGIFSGWQSDSLLCRAGPKSPDLVAQFMREAGATKAVLTYHPRLRRVVDNWDSILKHLAAIDGLSIASGDAWVDEFADCNSFMGDLNTSLFDVIAYTGRPILGVSSIDATRIELLLDGGDQPSVDWAVGTASTASVNLVLSVMS